jgi:hypothetical protein
VRLGATGALRLLLPQRGRCACKDEEAARPLGRRRSAAWGSAGEAAALSIRLMFSEEPIGDARHARDLLDDVAHRSVTAPR